MRINFTILLCALAFITQIESYAQVHEHISDKVQTPFELELASKRQSLTAVHYRYHLLHKGYPLANEHVVVRVTYEGEATVVHTPTYALPSQRQVLGSLPSAKDGWTDIEIDTVWRPIDGELVLTQRARYTQESKYYETYVVESDWSTPIDRSSYYVLDNDTDIIGKVFLPDPLSTSNEEYGGAYVDNGDADAPELNNERVSVSSTGTFENGTFHLKNDYVVIAEHSLPDVPPVTSANGTFDYTRSQSGFEDYNTLYHITAMGQYIHDLGFTQILNDPIPADCHALNGADNSNFTSFPSPRLNFGEGGVDDAEDADVVVHEYGHAVMYDIAPESNFGTERGALDEAIGDYIAASYSYMHTANHWFKVFTWDGHNEYWAGRLANEFRIYPNDLVNNVHADASIWSSPLMEIEFMSSRDVVTTNLLESGFDYFSMMTMKDAAELFLEADSALYNGAHWLDACIIFKERGLVDGCNGLSVADSETTNTYKVYPNVAGQSDPLTIEGRGLHHITIYSIDGRLVHDEENILPTRVDLPNGYFIIRIDGENEYKAIRY